MSPEFQWFVDRVRLEEFAASIEYLRIAAEDYISGLEHFEGYCQVCNSIHRMLVRSGSTLGDRPNLREGLLCEGCGLSNRKRLMYSAIMSEYRNLANLNGNGVLLLEGLSPLHVALSELIPDLIGSEYLGEDKTPGREYALADGRRIRHESLTCLSLADDSLKLISHSDVLEHVPDYKTSLRECFRVLVPGGSLLFTCPFFATRTDLLVRARRRPDGSVEHLEPPEWHGDPLSKDGILAWYHYGWGLLDELRSVGFVDVALGCIYDVFSGFVSNNFPGGGYGLMLPIVIRARKGH